jgi:glycerol dehydrogenase-like iron-containing ADH family enzyme
MAHKAKTTSDVSYSVSDEPEAYNNPRFGRRIVEYIEACKQKYGEDDNPSEHDIDTDIVMALGGGKKHERLGLVTTSSTVPARDLPTSEHGGRSLTPRYEHHRAWGWVV